MINFFFLLYFTQGEKMTRKTRIMIKFPMIARTAVKTVKEGIDVKQIITMKNNTRDGTIKIMK